VSSPWGDNYRHPLSYKELCWDTGALVPTPGVHSVEDGLTSIRVAMLQVEASDISVTRNWEIAENAFRKAAKMGADIGLLPELFSIGYSARYKAYNDSDARPYFQWLELAVTEASVLARFAPLARELDMALGVAYLEKWQLGYPPRNSLSLIDRRGVLQYTYAKMHTCTWQGDEAGTMGGRRFFSAVLDVGRGNITVGSIICADAAFMETGRQLARLGVELVLHPVACQLPNVSVGSSTVDSAMAIDNAIANVRVNHPHPLGCTSTEGMGVPFGCVLTGNSVATDHLGLAVTAAPYNTSSIVVAEINVTALRTYRGTARGHAVRQVQHNPGLCKLRKDQSFGASNFWNRTGGSVI